MIGLLAMVGIGVVLWWISRGLKKLSLWFTNLSSTAIDLVSVQNKAQSNKIILRQNKIAEEQLQNITGETSHVTFNHLIRSEINKLEQEINHV